MLTKKFKLKNRKGSILAFVLIIFLIVSVILSTVTFIFSSNLKMAKHQEENMRAHYFVLSGIDVTLSTLLSTLKVDNDGKDMTIIDSLMKDDISTTLSDVIHIDGQEINVKVIYEKGNKEITINSSTTLESGFTKDMSLKLEFSGDKFKKRWN